MPKIQLWNPPKTFKTLQSHEHDNANKSFDFRIIFRRRDYEIEIVLGIIEIRIYCAISFYLFLYQPLLLLFLSLITFWLLTFRLHFIILQLCVIWMLTLLLHEMQTVHGTIQGVYTARRNFSLAS